MGKIKQYPTELGTLEDAKRFIKESLLREDGKLKQTSIRFIPLGVKEDIKRLSFVLGLNSDLIAEQIYWIVNDLKEYPKKCLECGNHIIDFESFNQGYKSNFCSCYCLNTNKQVQQKKQQTNLNNLGVCHPGQSQQVKDKAKKTYLKNFGVEHNMKSLEGFQQNMKGQFRLKDYKLPSGRIVQLMGYEPFVVDYLLNNVYKEEDFDFQNIPSFRYDGKIYFPDLFIPKDNLIIEVKSDWTYKADLEKNLLKKQAVIDSGFNFKFYIWKKDLVQIL